MIRSAFRRSVSAACLAAAVVVVLPQFARTQGFSPLFGGGSEPTLHATLSPADAGPGDTVVLSLQVTLPAGGNTYSQDPSFAKPTEIILSESVGLEPLDAGFTSDHPPKREYDENFQKEVEKFFDEVTWSRKFRLTEGVAAENVFVRGKLKHLVCVETCVPHTHDFAVSLTGGPVPPPGSVTAAIAADAQPVAAADPVVFEQEVTPTRKVAGKDQPDPLKLTFTLSPEGAAAGETVTLTIVMEVDKGWHSYSLTKAENQIGLPTEIKLEGLHNLKASGEFTETPKAKLYNGTDNVHEGKVTWTREFKVQADGDFGVSGSIRYMICDDKSVCKPPKSIPIKLGVVPPDGTRAAAGPVGEQPAVAGPIDISAFTLVEADPPTDLGMNLLFAFLGGLLLNIMPCVLPVIAIKVLSFVQQAGESRGRIMALNVTYSLGVISVFLVLASLAVFLGKGWGSLFQYDGFNLVMAAVVFAMGLSLLGVFEIPVPGMVGSAAGGVHREGLLGAFSTGIFATLLATPCSGPFMGTTLAWSVKQSAPVIFLIWGVMGLGMASPYLLIGAFPRMVHWLPRPGMWMVRFKEFAGFVLMGAVVWILTFLNRDLIVPALVIFVGIALGLWMVGNLYDHSTSPGRKWGVRISALVMSVAICAFGYRMQYTSDRLPWQEFSTARVEELRSEGKPILIDFTADWCAICKTNEATALNKAATIRFVEEHGIVPLMADYTLEDPEIKEWLDISGQQGVPLTLIFPRGRSHEAIPLRGLYSQSELLTQLKYAVDPQDDAVQPESPARTASTAATGNAATPRPAESVTVR